MEITVIVCRKASDYLKPGNVTGYQCKVCGEKLQVTPAAVEAISKGGIPFCNACGFALRTLLEKDPTLILETRFSPIAIEQIMQRLRQAERN